MALLEIENLQVHFETDDGVVKAVDGISYSVDRGQTLGIVGESGSGKSVSSLTVMGLSRSRNARISGSIKFDGKELLTASDAEMRQIRGDDIAMIFQDPLSSLHPFYKERLCSAFATPGARSKSCTVMEPMVSFVSRKADPAYRNVAASHMRRMISGGTCSSTFELTT